MININNPRTAAHKLIAVFFLLFATSAFAQSRGFGAGIIAGETTGLSFKKWLTRSTAWDLALAWSLEGNNSFTVHADYLKHRWPFYDAAEGRLPLHYGIGPTVSFYDGDGKNDIGVGARVPVGLNYHIWSARVGVFVEVVPTLNLYPGTDFRIDAAIGVRYFFAAKRRARPQPPTGKTRRDGSK